MRHVPPEVALENEFGTYRKTYEIEGRVLNVRRKLILRAQRIPVDKYAAFREFTNQVDRADEAMAVLSKEGAEE